MKQKAWIASLSAMVLALCLGTAAQAAPGYPGAVAVTQPTGETLQISQGGDERLHWEQTEDGAVVLQDDAGAWHYAAWQEGALVLLPQQAGIDARPEGAATADQMLAVWKKSLSENARKSAQRAQGRSAAATNLKTGGPQNLLVVLVDFADVQIAFSGQWSARIFGDSNPDQPIGDSNGSVNGLYKEMSGGAFWFQPAAEAQGSANDGIIRVSLPMAHPAFPNSTDSRYSNPDAVFDANSRAVAVAALQAADASINYAQYDTNRDGILQPDELHLVIVLAGYENAYSAQKPGVWAHSNNLSAATAPRLDGVQVGLTYCQQGERMSSGRMMTIGVTAHELGHSLGLPDLYDTTGASDGVGMHSLMGGGSWGALSGSGAGSSPTHLDAWSRMMLGWGTVLTQNSGPATLNSSGSIYNILKIPTAQPGEYFLLENRQFLGYDAALASACRSGGVAIWHVDESVLDASYSAYGGWYNIQNNVRHKAVDLEEASEGVLGYSRLDNRSTLSAAYDSYFRAASQSLFHDTTKPSSALYGGKASGVQVNVLSASGPAMDVLLGTAAAPAALLRIDSLSEPGSPVMAGTPVHWACQTSGADNITYAYAVLDAAGSTVASAGPTAANTFDWRPLSAGTYRLQVTARSSDASAVRLSGALAVTANGHSPVLRANNGKLANGKISRYSVTVTASDADAGDRLTLTCSRNGADFPWPAKGVFSAEGTYVVAATDLAGHSATLRFAIDRAKPVIRATKESGAALKAGAMVNGQITVTVTDTTLSSRKITRNGRSYAWPEGGMLRADGAYVVTARDKLGNASTLRFTIDRTAPVIRARNGKVPLGDGQAAKSVVVTIAESNLRTKAVTRNGAAARWPSGGKFRNAGVYRIRAVDRAGNASVFTFTVSP